MFIQINSPIDNCDTELRQCWSSRETINVVLCHNILRDRFSSNIEVTSISAPRGSAASQPGEGPEEDQPPQAEPRDDPAPAPPSVGATWMRLTSLQSSVQNSGSQPFAQNPQRRA